MDLQNLNANDQWQGNFYADNSGPQHNWVKEFFVKPPFLGHEHVLDLGCGDGKLSAKIAGFLPKGSVTAIDQSASMLDTAKNNFPRTQFFNLDFVNQDVTNFNFEKQFDHVVSFSCMQWVNDQNAVLKNVRRHLKPKGKLYFHFPVKWHETIFGKAIETILRKDFWQSSLNGFVPSWQSHNAEEYFELLVNNNFVPQKISIVHKVDSFFHELQFSDWCRAWFPYLRALPNNLHDQFMSEFTKTYIDLCNLDSLGQIPWELFHLEIQAEAK